MRAHAHLVWWLMVAVLPPSALGYLVDTTSAGAEIQWMVRRVPFKINPASGPTGASASMQTAMNTWGNVSGATFQFSNTGSTALSGAIYNGTNVCSFGNLGTDGAVARNTKTFYTASGQLLDSDIVFNTYYSWSTTGAAGKYDVQNVATHELGHSLSLEDLYGSADVEKTMYGYGATGETKKRSLAADDASGITHLYPPLARPANDQFASAATISANSGTANNHGGNATAEPGEPAHAGRGPNQSVWYKFTPAASGTLAMDTHGSAFDTVLAIYTGSSVGGLTAVASNNDDGSAGNNSGWTAVALAAGTTYRIAVAGYSGIRSGAIVLNWTYTPWSLSVQPSSTNVTSSAWSGRTIAVAGNVPWTAVSNAAWLAVTSGSAGAGNGTVGFRVSANEGTTTRTGGVVVAGAGLVRTCTVTQAGVVGRPAAQGDSRFGVVSNSYGFNVSWASGRVVVVDVCTNLFNPIWIPVQTNLLSNTPSYFGDSQWTNYIKRFYRIRSP